WISFFTACRYTSVAVATVCNNVAPVFVVLLSPLLLKEKITRLQLFCTAVAFSGVVLISDVFGGSVGQLRGVLLGLVAAISYCGIIFCNKKVVKVGGLERTFFQMLFAAIITFGYVFFAVDTDALTFPRHSVLMLAILGIVHTGISFGLYLPVLERVRAQTASLLSYIEPLVAIIVSALVLHQELSGMQFAGIALIFAGTLLNEFGGKLMPCRRNAAA
ncbi:MAG: EamA family transporter, partial [Clostridia bacterium]|nr:EamA family transporter [Clostridia bacterium]